ncbi:HNH endonuclease [Sinorhizobium medicae]|uniref:HNH endonuclease n=1 Tax=Sinorhizobium medicae TaxID=110321 RepID=UPI000376CF51|nr:HNH endonuclease [Sinorhizobium medicae]
MRKRPRNIPYDHEWHRLARRFLKVFPLCSVRGCSRPAQHVDHVVTVRAAPERRLDWTNLQALCHRHHSRLTHAYDQGRLTGACDEDGFPVDPNHPWAQPTQREAIAAANREPVADAETAARLKRGYVRGERR